MEIRSKDYAGRECVLVHVKTGKPLLKDGLFTLDDQPVRITGGRAPHKPGSTGRAYVTYTVMGAEREFFPGVIDAQWMPLMAEPEHADTEFMPL